MATEKEIEYNRSFLSLYMCKTVYNEDERYQNRHHYPNGPPNRAKKVQTDAVYKAHVHGCPRWPSAAPGSGRQYSAYLLRGKGLEPLLIIPKRDQNFEDYATSWETGHSALVRGWFTPVLDEQFNVIAHYGSVGGGMGTTSLIAPAGVLNGADFVDDLHALMKSGVSIFVHSTQLQPPPGWARFHYGTTEHKLEVLATVDGEALDFTSYDTGHVESVNYSPADLLVFGSLLITLGRKVGARIVRALARKSGRTVLDGPTKKLAKELEKKAATSAAGSGKKFIREDEGVLAVIKDGKIIARAPATGTLSHEKFVVDKLGKDAIVKKGGSVELAPKLKGAEVVTIGKHGRDVGALRSKTFHDNQLPASQAAQDAVKREYH